MIYKKYEFSLSLYGTQVMHIARNTLGIVVFRAHSEKELKDMIDESLYLEAQNRAAEAKKRAEKAKVKKKGLAEDEVENEAENETEPEEELSDEKKTDESEKESILVPSTPPQTRVTRGPDGKFISQSALEKEEPEKKSFWDKLK